MSRFPKPKCENCEFYIFTKTLGSPLTPEWHCRSGFSPLHTSWYYCVDLARKNYQALLRQQKEGACPESEVIELSLFDDPK